jgi:hypothetical protein
LELPRWRKTQRKQISELKNENMMTACTPEKENNYLLWIIHIIKNYSFIYKSQEHTNVQIKVNMWKKSSTKKSWPTFCDQYFWKFPIWNSRADEKRREIRMVKVNVIFNDIRLLICLNNTLIGFGPKQAITTQSEMNSLHVWSK